MSTTPVFAPDGTLGDIPTDRVADALKQGATLGIPITAPDGTPGVVPVNNVHDAIKAGGLLQGAPPPNFAVQPPPASSLQQAASIQDPTARGRAIQNQLLQDVQPYARAAELTAPGAPIRNAANYVPAISQAAAEAAPAWPYVTAVASSPIARAAATQVGKRVLDAATLGAMYKVYQFVKQSLPGGEK